MKIVPPESMPGERQLTGVRAYEDALDELIANTTQTLRIFDRSIGPNFNTPRRYDLLRQLLLARRTNRIYVVLHETANITRDCPRISMLIKRYGHALFIRQTLPAAHGVYDPFAVGDDNRFVHRFHYNGIRAVAAIADVADTHLLLKRFGEIWEASVPAMAATTLGL